MSTELATALIALIGVAISVLASYLSSRRQIKTEIEKTKSEIEQMYGGKLHDKRLEFYPILYSRVSELITDIRFGEFDKQRFAGFYSDLRELAGKYGIFFSIDTINTLAQIMYLIKDFSQKTDQEIATELSSEDSRRVFRRKLQELEISLKHEIGAFVFESPAHVKEVKRRYLSYSDATETKRDWWVTESTKERDSEE